MLAAYQLCQLYAPSRTMVVFVGDTGSGKSYLAWQLHLLSPRASEPFVDVTAAELLDGLADSQLFGHVRGAFTDAKERRAGLFEEAGRGTFLLDDLHLLRESLQAKLLRVLTRGVYRPVGAHRDYPVRCRVLVGLRESPEVLMQSGRLLPDLCYRLGHCIITLPRLADRREDIAALAISFLHECPSETGVTGPASIAREAMTALEGLRGWGMCGTCVAPCWRRTCTRSTRMSFGCSTCRNISNGIRASSLTAMPSGTTKPSVGRCGKPATRSAPPAD
jgi:DNA-binding NtrC family response regulator